MTATDGAVAAAEDLRELLARTVASLDASGAPDEAMAIRRPPGGFWAFKTAARMVPVGRAWRLGVLLLDRQGNLYATGEVTRAIQPLRGVTNRSPEAERRREDRRAAVRGHFATGEAVNFGFFAIALDAESLALGSGPLWVVNDTVMVRWDENHPDHGVSRLDSYLADRASLLTME